MYDKRSIFEDENGNKFYCKLKYTNDFAWHYDKMIKRYASKDEWKGITPATKEQILSAQKNCNKCKYTDNCSFDIWRASLDKIKCKHDIFGVITEFDNFVKRN